MRSPRASPVRSALPRVPAIRKEAQVAAGLWELAVVQGCPGAALVTAQHPNTRVARSKRLWSPRWPECYFL